MTKSLFKSMIVPLTMGLLITGTLAVNPGITSSLDIKVIENAKDAYFNYLI